MGKIKNVVEFGYNDVTFKNKVRELALAGSITYTKHAKKRMKQRGLTITQVLNCLKHGNVSEPAHLNIHNNWQATLSYYTAGDSVSVAACISNIDGEIILIITVMS